MGDSFPLTRQLGLEVAHDPTWAGNYVVDAKRLESLLAKAVRVHAYCGPASRKGGMWILEGHHDADSTHTALLVGIEPIKAPDSFEQLAKDLIEGGEAAAKGHFNYPFALAERARRLLEGK